MSGSEDEGLAFCFRPKNIKRLKLEIDERKSHNVMRKKNLNVMRKKS